MNEIAISDRIFGYFLFFLIVSFNLFQNYIFGLFQINFSFQHLFLLAQTSNFLLIPKANGSFQYNIFQLKYLRLMNLHLPPMILINFP